MHVYGSLGKYPNERGFKNELSAESVVKCASSIKIYSEDREHEQNHLCSEEVKYARELVNSADQIVFLGFGYLRENVQRIGAKISSSEDKRIFWGSGFGLSGQEMLEARLFIGGENEKKKKKVFIDNNVGCLAFMRDCPVFHRV